MSELQSRPPIILDRPAKTQQIEIAWLPPGTIYQNHASQIYQTGQRDRDTDKRYLSQYTYKRVFIAGWWQSYHGVVAHTEPTELYYNPDRHDGYPMHHPWCVVYEGDNLKLYDLQRKPLTRGQTRYNPWWAVELTDADDSSLQVPDLTQALPIDHIPDLMPSRELPDPRFASESPSVARALPNLCPAAQAFVSLPIHTLAALSNRKRIESIAAYAWHVALWMTDVAETDIADDDSLAPMFNQPNGWPQAHSHFFWYRLIENEPVPLTLKEVFGDSV